MSSIRNIALSFKNLVKQKHLNEKIVKNTLPLQQTQDRHIKEYNNMYSEEFLNFTLFNNNKINKNK